MRSVSNWCKIFVVVICLKCVSTAIRSSSNDISRGTWIQESLQLYPEWLKSQGDPFPPNSAIMNATYTNGTDRVDIKVWNTYAFGLADYAHYDLMGAFLDVEGRFLGIESSWNNIGVGGDYKANGTIHGSIPVTGEGKWNTSIGGVMGMFHQLNCHNFTITHDNHIDLTNATMHSSVGLYALGNPENSLTNINIEGLSAGRFEEEVKYGLFTALYGATMFSVDHPLVVPLKQYLKQIFDTTSVSEM